MPAPRSLDAAAKLTQEQRHVEGLFSQSASKRGRASGTGKAADGDALAGASTRPRARAAPTVASQRLNERFRRIAARIACALGSPWSFASAVAVIVAWAAAGPFLHYSENWQLVVNTGTTIATFLMLFVLQNSQNRDTKAINIKLDELLRAIEGARTGLAAVGDLSDEELEALEEDFRNLAAKATASAAAAALAQEARGARRPAAS